MPADPFAGYSDEQMEAFRRAEDRFLGIGINTEAEDYRDEDYSPSVAGNVPN